ncbi:hypothetical protein FKM82_005303 [Ascaphus truei]
MCVESGKRSRQRPAVLPTLPCPDSGPVTGHSRLLPQAATAVPARSRLPEIFTFDVESVQPAAPRRNPAGARRQRPRRVLYPSKVKRYMPPQESDRALRWLYVLCLMVLVQICSEEEELRQPGRSLSIIHPCSSFLAPIYSEALRASVLAQSSYVPARASVPSQASVPPQVPASSSPSDEPQEPWRFRNLTGHSISVMLGQTGHRY